jgi:hypothetical protein
MKTVALRAVTDELTSSTGGAFAEDNDLELIGESLPWVKLMESIPERVPDPVEKKRERTDAEDDVARDEMTGDDVPRLFWTASSWLVAATADVECALELPGNARTNRHAAFATATVLPAPDRGGFAALLENALAVDLETYPEHRLSQAYAQQKATSFLDHLADLFL